MMRDYRFKLPLFKAALVLIFSAASTAWAAAQVEAPLSTAPEVVPGAGRTSGPDSMSGSFSRSIGIAVPAWHGVEPQLGLGYSSQGGSGFVGVGWSLGGFSSIERTRRGMGTPRWDAEDVFVLGGQKLIPCAQASSSPGCQAGGSHATEQESYTRIVRNVSENTWTVTDRNGWSTTYSPVYQGTGGTLRWGIASHVDLHGNTAIYVWESVGGDCYPRQVSFGPYRVTIFRDPTPRPDPRTFAIGSPTTLGSTLYRLGSVLVARGSTPIRAYRLTYRQSAATGRSLLQAVQQYGLDVQIDASGVITGGTTLPAETFTYREQGVQ